MSEGERFWFKDAVFYELRIRSFYDSDGDGIGDIRGVVERLDYLQDLGVTALWFLPFYPSPLRDDGYDIADYTDVHPECGTLRDFRLLLREAHRRNLRVVTELVLNHTSDQHPWFQRARRAPAGSRWRDFYVWSDDPNRYADARIIFKDFEHSNWTWDAEAGAYFWHRFFSNQPDLNFDNPEVRRALTQAMDFWLEMGVDGLRLDAVPYLFEREGTSCENLPETHEFLRELRAHVDANFENRMLLAEANQWPEDAVAYFGADDECHAAFHFPIMPRLFMAVEMTDRHPVLDILEQTPKIPDGCQWLMFLRNHDELTLEMVTDEERNYMVRAYAPDPRARINLGIRRRLAPLLDNDRRKIELMNALLFSLPGTPVIYYGDEIGMGDNIYLGDRNGVRTPMQWSSDRNAGFSRTNPQRMILPVVVDPEYHYEARNVETMQANPSSLLWWTKRIVHVRKQHPAFGRGTLEPLTPANRKVLAFLRHHEDDTLLVVANLSRSPQYVELDLRRFAGYRPHELFGNIDFPLIGELPYLLTLGAYGFYWLELRCPGDDGAGLGSPDAIPQVRVENDWERLFDAPARVRLESRLAEILPSRRWFRSKARRITSARIVDRVELDTRTCLAFLRVDYSEGDEETYAVPLAFLSEPGYRVQPLLRLSVEQRGTTVEGVVVDGSDEPRTASLLVDLVRRRRRIRGQQREVMGVPTTALRRRASGGDLDVRPIGTEQSNSSWRLGDDLVVKLFRRIEDGPHPELEIARHLDAAGFEHVAKLAGAIEIVTPGADTATLAVVHVFVPNEGEAWSYTIDELERYFERALSARESVGSLPPAPALLKNLGAESPPDPVAPVFGGFLETARLLGRRTGELHLALADAGDDPAFTPEPFTPFARRAQYQSLRNLLLRTFTLLAEARDGLSAPIRELAGEVLGQRDAILERFALVREKRGWTGTQIRLHGDYHLGQVLYTGKDFAIMDFEGEPARPLGERRLKRSPLVDVAGMLRSFDYAVESVLSGSIEGSVLRREDVAALRPWAQHWSAWVSAAFLQGYTAAVAPGNLVPTDPDELRRLLEVHVLEKALYEIGYELNNRPDWVAIPLRGILGVLGKTASRDPAGGDGV